MCRLVSSSTVPHSFLTSHDPARWKNDRELLIVFLKCVDVTIKPSFPILLSKTSVTLVNNSNSL